MPAKRNPKLISNFNNGTNGLCLYLMPNGRLLLQKYDLYTRWIIEQYNTIRDNIDEIGMANKFEEIKENMMNEGKEINVN